MTGMAATFVLDGGTEVTYGVDRARDAEIEETLLRLD